MDSIRSALMQLSSSGLELAGAGMTQTSRFQRLWNNRLAVILTAAGGVMVAGLVAIFLIGRAALEADQDLLRQHMVIGELQEALSTLKDAETGQRGYLLTGDEAYLRPYDQALTRIHEEIGALDGRVTTGELSEPEMQRLWNMIGRKLTELQETI